jgi:hypothetical protein
MRGSSNRGLPRATRRLATPERTWTSPGVHGSLRESTLGLLLHAERSRSGLWLERHMLANNVPKDLGCLRRFEAAIEAEGRLNAAMSKNAPDKLIIARMMLKDESTCSMPELMHRNPQPSGLHNPLCDLLAQDRLGLVPAVFAGEHPVLIASA